MNTGLNRFKISDWVWIFYPLIVVTFIIVSAGYLLGSGSTSIQVLLSKQQKTDDQQNQLSKLKLKLETLKSADTDQEGQKLTQLLVAMPPAKRVWYLLEAVNKSASDAGVLINQFNGNVGDVKEATASATVSGQITPTDQTQKTMSLNVEFAQMDFPSMTKIISELEGDLPLVKVKKVDFTLSKTTIDLEGGWGQLIKPSLDATLPLPNYIVISQRALQHIQGMSDLTTLN